MTFASPGISCIRPATPRRHRTAAAVWLAGWLALATSRESRAVDTLDYKFAAYAEDRDRVRVITQSARVETSLGSDTRLSFQGTVDTITGATPNGEPAPPGSDQVPLDRLRKETRHAGDLELTHGFGRHTATIHLSASKEPDYRSRAIAFTDLVDFNQKNTVLELGYAHTDDRNEPFFFAAPRPKRSDDLLIGLTQILDPRTTLTVDLSHGHSHGYLGDPYKAIVKDVVVDPAHPELLLTLPFPENRPSARDRWTVFTRLVHSFDTAHGSLEATYRWSSDDWGIHSHTVQLSWLQKLGSRFVLIPSLRCYEQSAADFYHLTLNGTSIDPVGHTGGTPPYYSADYRLARLRTTTVGLKLVANLTGHLHGDIAYDRYVMHGRDGFTPQSAFPTAGIVTIGLGCTF